MPVTPLHFGPALAVRELTGHKKFGIWAFAATQVMFDIEPIARIVLDLDGTLHQTTHTETFGIAYALLAILALWKWERWSAVTGAVFGVVTHLWFDALYHDDVARALAKWGIAEPGKFDADWICLFGFFCWLLFMGIRYVAARGAPAIIRSMVRHEPDRDA